VKKLWKPALLLAAIAVMMIGMLGSGAWFTDQDTHTTASISSGKLSLKNEGFTSTSLGSITNWAPGDESGEVVITIENNGTMPLAWFGNLVVSDSILKDAIVIKHAQMRFLSPAGASWEPADDFIVNGIGYTKLGANTKVTLANFDGNPGMAPGTKYEFMGALKPNYKYQLVLQFAFDEAAGNEYQSAGPIDISFVADATQIKSGALGAYQMAPHLGWFNAQIAKQTIQ